MNGFQLRMARVKKRITQYQLALLTSIHQPRISLIENDLKIPTDEEKKKMAEALDLPVEIIWPAKEQHTKEGRDERCDKT